jgi:phosphatidylserine decarboxylase
MMFFRSRFFFWSYRFLPHRLLNRCARWLMRARSPRWLVHLVIRRWIKSAAIPMREFEETSYASVEEFFLRRIRPEARPLEEGWIAPVDGILLAQGRARADTIVQVKGSPVSIPQMVNGSLHHESLAGYEGGSFLTIFLTPHGYHRIHLPCDASIEKVLWLPGRLFPQNEDAIHHIPRIYERNERATLCCRARDGSPFLMTLVGASLIGSIHLKDLPRRAWARTQSYRIAREGRKGDEIAHFSFGSTIVLLLPAQETEVRFAFDEGQAVKMGQSLFRKMDRAYGWADQAATDNG